MYRKSNGGIISNNTIVYNRLVNKKTKNITNENEKINCNGLYKYSVSNSTKKALNRRDKYYRITEDDFDFELDDY